ncbi:MAG: helix-turn-helix domain-containing protein [Verrucomicrobiota bacterium]
MTEEVKSVGKELKSARRAKSWSVERAAYATKLRADIIAKIEADRYDQLPNPAYARGFVRIYARELGLDPYPILKRLNGVVDETADPGEFIPENLETLPNPMKKHIPKTQNVGLMVIAMIIFGGLLIGGIQLYRIWPVLFGNAQTSTLSELTAPMENPHIDDNNAEVRRAEPIAKAETVVATEEETSVKKAEPISASASVAHYLKLSADEDCWVKVQIVTSGKEVTVFEDLIPEGATIPADSEQGWTGEAFIVTIRDTSKVNITFDNQNYGKYDRSGYQTFRIPSN